MVIQLRQHDGTSNDIDLAVCEHAREIATSFDWESERRRFEQLEETGAECYLPCISLMDDATRTLEFGPNADATFWICYRYWMMKSSYGFCLVDNQRELQMQSCVFEKALDLMDLHYAGKHDEIIALFPDENDLESESN